MQWVYKLREQTNRLVTCYEAGCFGYVLHRKLETIGIRNFVVRPRNWDEYGAKVKIDGRDARQLCSCLDRYLAGNDRALSLVRVPSEEQERSRSLSRQREVLLNERKRLQNVGISNARYYGIELQSTWWKEHAFKKLLQALPDYLLAILKPFQISAAQHRHTTERSNHTRGGRLQGLN